MFIHTRVGASKRFGWHKQTFCGEKEERAVSQTQVKTDYI